MTTMTTILIKRRRINMDEKVIEGTPLANLPRPAFKKVICQYTNRYGDVKRLESEYIGYDVEVNESEYIQYLLNKYPFLDLDIKAGCTIKPVITANLLIQLSNGQWISNNSL